MMSVTIITIYQSNCNCIPVTVILFIIYFANDSCLATAPIVYLVLAILCFRRFQLESEQYYTESR